MTFFQYVAYNVGLFLISLIVGAIIGFLLYRPKTFKSKNKDDQL